MATRDSILPLDAPDAPPDAPEVLDEGHVHARAKKEAWDPTTVVVAMNLEIDGAFVQTRGGDAGAPRLEERWDTGRLCVLDHFCDEVRCISLSLCMYMCVCVCV